VAEIDAAAAAAKALKAGSDPSSALLIGAEEAGTRGESA